MGSEWIGLALNHFGTNRAAAFPILERAIQDPEVEARKQAVAAMGYVGKPEKPGQKRGPAAPGAVPLLWQILHQDNKELNHLALTSLRDIQFQPQDLTTLTALLVRSDSSRQLPRQFLNTLPPAGAQNLLEEASDDQLMQRYLPEAIAETIRQDPEACAPFMPLVERLLDDSNFDIRFGAACALAEYKGVDDAKISSVLSAGLFNSDPDPVPGASLKTLMAIQTLQRIGPKASRMVPALLEYATAKSTTDPLMRKLALKAAGKIDDNLRTTIPEVDQALKNPNLP